MRKTTAERFWSKVRESAESDGCWTWTASCRRDGYGQFWTSQPDRRLMSAHRWSYEASRGQIPDGLDLDHLCRNRACVRPSHLEPVTRRENLLRGETRAAANAAKTHCPVGHPYDKANTLPKTGGGRSCRACRAARRMAA